MKLFQYENFFANHFDPEVKQRGSHLIALVDKMQCNLLVSDWINWPTIEHSTRMEEIKLMAIIHAIDRTSGKSEAAKWLGISKQTIFDYLDMWNNRPNNI